MNLLYLNLEDHRLAPLTGSELPEFLATYRQHFAPAPGAADLGNMFQFMRDFCASRSIEEARRLNPGLQTFATWLAQIAPRIPLR